MSKKIKCRGCENEFVPTADVTPAICPMCNLPDKAQSATARAAFSAGEPIQVAAASGDEFDIQWMPPGAQSPCCTVGDEAKQLSFTVKSQHAQAFNAQLQRLRNLAAAGQGDAPFIDFDHQDGRASGRPTEMYWGGEDPKAGGIRLKGKWTASGKASVTGPAPEFTRFSPEWYFNDDHEPIAIGANLGGLVNKAAFKNIASVKAGAATQQQKNTMTKEELQAAMTEALKPVIADVAALKTAQGKSAEKDPATAGVLDETALNKALAKAMEPFTAKITAIETDGKKAQAKAAVAKYITAPGNAQGVIAPADTAAIEFWENAYLANAKSAEDQLNKLGARTPVKIVMGAGQTVTHTNAEFSEPENRALAGAKKIKEANKAIASDAQALEAFLKTPEGNQAYAEILIGRSEKPRADIQVAR
jgi:hypothetical protein